MPAFPCLSTGILRRPERRADVPPLKVEAQNLKMKGLKRVGRMRVQHVAWVLAVHILVQARIQCKKRVQGAEEKQHLLDVALRPVLAAD